MTSAIYNSSTLVSDQCHTRNEKGSPPLAGRLRGHGCALLLLTLVLALHLWVNLTWIRQAGAPWFFSAPHEQLAIIDTAALLRPPLWDGELSSATASAFGLTPTALPGRPPPDPPSQREVHHTLLRGVLTNDGSVYSADQTINTYHYKVSSPVFYLASAVPWLVTGPSAESARLGPWVLVALTSLAVYAAAAQLASPGTALAAAVLVTLYPGIFGHARSAGPFFGATAGVSLVVVLVWASHGLSRPFLALLAGGAAALSLRWGETLGDGLTAALCAAPAVGVVVLSWASRVREAPARALAGAGMATLGVWALIDWRWIDAGLVNYILREMFRPRPGQRVGDLSSSWEQLSAMAHTTLHTLTGATPALLLGVAILPFAWRHRRSASAWGALGWALLPPLVLGLSAKRQNFYLTPMLPGVAIVTAVGLRALPRVGAWMPGVAVALMVPPFLYQSFPEHPAWGGLTSSPLAQTWLGDDVLGPARTEPLGDFTEGDVFVRPVVELAHSPMAGEDALWRWLTRGEGADWIRCAPTGGALPVFVSSPTSELLGFAAQVAVRAYRPDLHVTLMHNQAELERWVRDQSINPWQALIHLPALTPGQAEPALRVLSDRSGLSTPAREGDGPSLRVYAATRPPGRCR